MINQLFLISQPRSGSTLLQKILSSNPNISTTSEPWICLPLLFDELCNNINFTENAKYNGKIANNAINSAFFHGKELKESKKLLSEVISTFYSFIAKKKDASIFLDKTPRYYYILDELLEFFPECKIIFLHRNPLYVFNSILNTWVKQEYFVISRYRDDLFLAPHKFKKYFNHPRIHNVFYEELVESPENVIKGIYEYLDLKYSKEYLTISDVTWKVGDIYNLKSKLEITSSFNNKLQVRNSQEHRLLIEYFNYLKKNNLLLNKSYETLDIFKENKKVKYALFTFSLAFLTSPFASVYLRPVFELKIKFKRIIIEIWSRVFFKI